MPQQRTITTAQGLSIHAELDGDGPPTVWVAGLGDDSSSWERPQESAALVREFLRHRVS